MSIPLLQRKFSWFTSAAVVAFACVFIFMAAGPLTDWISFDWLVTLAVTGGIALFTGVVSAGVISARKREFTRLQYSIMFAVGAVCLVLSCWLPVVWCGGFLLPFGAAALITIYVQKTRERAEPGAAPNGGPATSVGSSRVSEGPPSVS